MTVKVGQQVNIRATATDADSDTISYAWTRKSGETTPALPETTLGARRLRFTPTQAGVYTMTVTATDGNGNSDTKTVTITVNAKTVVSVPTTLAVTEGTDTNATVTISVAEAFGQSVTFNVTYGGTATGAGDPADGDYDNDAVTSVTFSTADTSKNIVIPITDDDLDEAAETIIVTIAPSAALPAGFVLGNATATVTITDDDNSPVLDDLTAVRVKAGQQVNITANATDADSDTVSYAWTRKAGETTPALPGGTALNAKRLRFTPTTTGTYTMTVTASDGNGNSDTKTVVITVLADTPVSVPETVAVTEGTDSNATVAISVAEAFGQSVTFNVSYSGTATGAANPADGDYDNDAATSVTFGTTDTSKNIVIPITDDDLDEAAETIVVTIAPSAALPAGFTLGNAATTVTVTDDDNSPVLGDLAAVGVKVGQQVDITANATDTDSDTISYTWTRKNGETTPALPGGTALNTKRLTFTPTATGTYTMTVTANDGNGNTDTKTVVITVAAKVVVSVPTTVAVTEGTDSNATVTISLAEGFGQSVTFNVTYGGTATGASDPADGDYDNDAVTSVTFSTSDTSKNIVIPITDDGLDEAAETITVTVAPSAALPAGFTLGNAAATVTVTDDDNSPVLGDLAAVGVKVGQQVDITANATDADTGDTISYAWTRKAGETTPALPGGTALNAKRLTFTPTTTGTYTMTVTANDGNGNSDTETVVITVTAKVVVSVPATVAVTEGTDTNATVTISLAEGFGQSVTFNITYSGTATGAANPADGDYDNDAVTSVTFNTSDTSKNIVIPITNDGLDETAETITVTIAPSAALPAGYTLGNAATTVTITDDDNSPVLGDLADVTLKVGQLVDITANATDADSDTISYTWTRKAGETTPALPGGTALNTKRLTFTPTATGTYTMTVTANDGNGNTDTKTVVITVGAKVVVSVPTTVAVTEGTDSNATVTISLAESFGQSVTFNVTYGGTATGAANPADGDYDNDAVTSVTFGTSDTSKNIVIPITDDGLDETAETIIVTVAPSAALPAGYTLGNAATTVTITDDDDSPVLGDLADVGVKVGQQVDITANATDTDGDTISYAWTRKSGESTPALPETTLSAKRLRFTPTAVGTYTMTVTASDGNGNTDTKTVVITVAAKVVVSVPAAVAVTEGTNSNATVTISLAEAFDQSVTFNITYGGTATGANNPANGDYDNNEVTSVTFSTSDTSKNVVIPITDDGLDENAETIIVTVAPSAALPAGYTLGNATTTVTITDDDNSPVLEDLTDVTLKAGQQVDITANATDTDADTISYTWTRKSGETTPALPPSTALNAKRLTFTPTTTGTYTMTVTANDGNANTDTKTVTITVNPKVVVSVPATVAVTEGTDSNATVTISLAEAFGQSVVFNIDYGGTATGATDPSNGDYDNDTITSVTFGTSDTSKNIVIPITDDGLDETAETITITIDPSPALPAGYRLGNAVATVTITDDDNSPVLEELTDVTLKAGQQVDITANATDADGDTISYTWSRKASENLPALPQSTALGAKQLMFTPTTAGVYTMTVTAGDGNANTDAETVVITVNPKTVVSVPAAVVATEGNDKNATVTISLAEAFTQPVTFNITYAGTATGAADPANGDYDNDAVTSITFSNSDTSKNIVIPITDDNVVEGAETIVVTIAPSAALPAGYRLGNTVATVTITDYDSFPLQVTTKVGQLVDVIATAASTDDDNPYTYQWTRKTGETAPPLPTGTLLNQARLTFTPTRMGTYTMTVTATDSNNNTVSTETVTITVVADTVISVPAMVSVTEGTDNFAAVRISTAEPPTQDVTFRVIYDTASIGGITAGGTATDGTDFGENITQVVLEANERFADIMIPITNDGVDEGDEWFSVIIAPINPLPDGFVMGNTITIAKIADDDSSPILKPLQNITVRAGQKVNIAASATDNDADTITYQWSRKDGETTPPLPENTALDTPRLTFTPTQVGTYTMTVTASDGNGNTDTRTVVVAVVATLRFGPDEVSKTITIPIPDDEVDEETETITVTIEPVGPLPAGFGMGNATATITVIDDDNSPALEPLNDIKVQAGQRIDITATATHTKDNETITYTWAREPGETAPPLPTGTTLNTARLRFTTTTSGTYTMTITATDTHNNTDTQTVIITVGTPPTPEEHEISPTDNHTNPLELAPLNNLVLRLGQQVNITATATHTNEDEVITYAWTREPDETTPPLPEGTILNTAQLTFTPTQTGTYTMTVTATDTNDYAYLRTITITITNNNLISIQPTTTTVTEGTNPTTTITITLDQPLQQPVNFNLHYTHHQPQP
ncbi:PKD domain-containing protein [Candidatus Poriferisocius sp.]|uniref:beta strand repeat-containing protein n=1 Tax=Candidatus Poriferisocius sp. TaxID=3101276 RepID=UPI003B02322C